MSLLFFSQLHLRDQPKLNPVVADRDTGGFDDPEDPVAFHQRGRGFRVRAARDPAAMQQAVLEGERSQGHPQGPSRHGLRHQSR